MNLKKILFGITRIKLPEKLSVFSDFLEDITIEDEADEYIGYIRKVIEGEYEDFDITLNATSINIMKNETIAEHHYRIDELLKSTIDTTEFLELILVWKDEIK